MLRPEPGTAATCRRAAEAGVAAVAAPLFEVRPLAWDVPAGAFDAVMTTSANALRLGGAAVVRFVHLPLYAVGSSTAAAARAAGFTDVRAGHADVAALLALAAGEGVRTLLHLGGRERREAAHDAIAIVTVDVYAAEPVAALPAAVPEALTQRAVALLHSPRAGALFGDLIDRAHIARGGVRIAAISDRALAAAGPGWQAGVAATVPTDDALLAVARGLGE